MKPETHVRLIEAAEADGFSSLGDWLDALTDTRKRQIDSAPMRSMN